MKERVINPVQDPIAVKIRETNLEIARKHPYLFVYLENGDCFLLSFKEDALTSEYMIIRKHLYYKKRGHLFKKKLGRVVGCKLMDVES